MQASLIISTYNRPDALRVCLLSVFSQSVLPQEIIVGDDGSKDDTRKTIDDLRKISPVKIKHLWQEDKGFRLAKMRNKCIAASTTEYIIEIDGDVILHHDFIKDHIAFAKRGHYLKGGRVNIGRKLTEVICREQKECSLSVFTPGFESKRENALHLPTLARYLAPRYRQHKESALGCNMSFFKDDILAINGYDEFYEGWGGEDGDLGRRLQLYGLKKRHLKFAGIVFHLWHDDKYMYNKEKNFKHSYRTETKIVCEEGVDKYLNNSEHKYYDKEISIEE